MLKRIIYTFLIISFILLIVWAIRGLFSEESNSSEVPITYEELHKNREDYALDVAQRLKFLMFEANEETTDCSYLDTAYREETCNYILSRSDFYDFEVEHYVWIHYDTEGEELSELDNWIISFYEVDTDPEFPDIEFQLRYTGEYWIVEDIHISRIN